MEDLPDVLLQNILSRLDIISLFSAASACRFLHLSATQSIRHLPNFHLLDLALSNDDVKRISYRILDVRSLKLDCKKLDDQVLVFIMQPQLEELELINCNSFSPKFFSEIGRYCRGLRNLSAEFGWEDLSGHSAGVVEGLMQCPHLETFSLKGHNALLDSYAYSNISSLVSSRLKVLELGYVLESNAKQVLHYSYGTNTEQWRNLQKLCLGLDRVTDTLVMLISQRLPQLLDLELQDQPAEEPLLAFDLTTTGLQHLRALSSLQRLVLVRSQIFYPATFRRVEDLGFLLLAEKCKKLEMIRLGGFSRISDATCRQILHSFLNLHTFQLLKAPRITDLTFRDISAVPVMLVSITLASCSLISDSSIQQLLHCKDLEILNIKGCKCVGDAGLSAIAGLSKLKTLNLSGLDISDGGLSVLGKASMPLVSLSLLGCQRLSDAGITELVGGSLSRTLECIDLSNIPSLTDKAVLELIHSGMRIVNLRLRNCFRIGNTTVIALASMNFNGCGYGGTLRLLDLSNCKELTFLSIGWFKKPYFPKLRWLGLSRSTAVGKSVLELLGQQRPYLHILDDDHELDGYTAEDIYGFHQHYHEEEDELERWLRVG